MILVNRTRNLWRLWSLSEQSCRVLCRKKKVFITPNHHRQPVKQNRDSVIQYFLL